MKTATRQEPDGGGGWRDVAVSYHRYYTSGSMAGFQHGLKMHFGPEACRRMFNDGVDFTTAADVTIRPYADHCFEYGGPSGRRVTLEVSAVCESCPGGGTTSDAFAYASNPRRPAPGSNVWATRTTQTLPDGSKVIVYSNFAGMTMLYVNVDASGTRKWARFSFYDQVSGRFEWEAEPSAVTGYDEAYDDLLNYNSGTGRYQYLRDGDGLIRARYTFSSGAGVGQLASERVRRGQLGAEAMVRSYTYGTQTAGGVTIHPLATMVEYPNESDPNVTLTTNYSYTFHAGTNVVSQKTTTLPVAPTNQNGSGVAATIVEEFDLLGHLTRRTDERGIVSEFVTDAALGVVTRQTLNVQAGVTAPGVNVVTDFTYDGQGRRTRTLGPGHTVVLSGVATTVRAAEWTVYTASARPAVGTIWGPDEQRGGQGYATGADPNYTFALIDPVSLARKDKDGRTLDQITSKRTTGTGALSPTDTFAQTDWKSWGSTQYDNQHRTTSSRVYHLIPTSGVGTAGTNYGQADYGYDALERRNRVKSPGGTIARTVWTAPQREASTWVGTDDTGATDANPAGTGAPNNMVLVAENQYDGGTDGGDGNLTQVTQYAATSDTRVTTFGYDWRDRRTSEDGEIDLYVQSTYDNLDRVTQTDRRNTTAAGALVGRAQTKFDDRGRVYQRVTYAVDPATGAVGNALTSNTWYDAAGNVIQQVQAGDGGAFTKNTYNGVGWETATYRGYNTSGVSYAQAATVANDTIFSQSEHAYDEAGNAVSVASSERLNDATGTGALTAGAQPKARVSYNANWYDGIDRAVAAANYGAIAGFTRPSTVPARSDDVLVTETAYDDAGRAWKSIDPRGIENRTAFDAAGRTTQTVEAYSATIADDTNRTTNYTYTLDNQIATLTAVNARTGDQTTTYTYGTTLTDSGVARNDLLRFTAYPDSTGPSDRTANTYNRLGQRAAFTDQRGTVHSFDYDKLGRLAHDRVTTVGTNTDNAVLRISRTYELRGMVQTITSYDNATVGSGTVLDQVKLEYNSFGQLTKESQDHNGAVGIATPSVQYAYASGASNSNQVRPTTLTYPNARAIAYDYGTGGGADDRLSRINAIKDGATTLAAYTYLGSGTVIRIDYPQPQVRLDLWGGTSGTFAGLDAFNRIKDQRWLNYNTSTDLDRYQYGYDRNSSRTWKQNALTTGLDEFYAYDQLNRLATMDRGTLNGTKTGITGTPAIEQDWTLDPTGNWRGYLTKAAGTTDLNQARTHNPVNEITAITETAGPSWIDPAYDAAGNTTTFPKGGNPTQALTATFDPWNRMTQVKDAGILIARYRYDGRSRRIVIESYTSGMLTETRHVYYTTEWQAVEERVGAATTADRQYVWGVRYIDELVSRDRTVTGGIERLYAAQDANYNVTALIDNSGAVVERYQYLPYGSPTVLNPDWSTDADGTDYAWYTLHQGLRYEDVTGLYDNFGRFYSPALGRPVQADPLGYPDGMSRYDMYGSNPPSTLDPSGLLSWSMDDRCTITLNVTITIRYWGAWTPARQAIFEKTLQSQIQRTFNKGRVKIYPAAPTESTCCKCQAGWTPVLKVTFQAALGGDFNASVEANPAGPPITSTARNGSAKLDEQDVQWHDRGGGNQQLPGVHEFGHLMGLPHPGHDQFGPMVPRRLWNKAPDYDADAPGLMGRGMQMRPHYYDKWIEHLNDYACAGGSFTAR